MKIILPWPVSLNAMYKNVRRNRRAPSRAYRLWKEAAQNHLLSQRIKIPKNPLDFRLALTITLQAPDRRKRDISNFIKAPEDFLVERGFIMDDSLIDKLIVIRAPSKQPGCVTLEIFPHE